MVGIASVMFVSAELKGAVDGVVLLVTALMGAGGVGMMGTGALGLPRWARLRQRQINEIAERIGSVNRSS